MSETNIPVSIGEDEYHGCVITTMHDAIVRRKGGSRFDTSGRKIKPMGTQYAADLAGWSLKATANALDVNQETHIPSFRAFLRWVYHGLDISVIRTILRPRRIAVFQMPEVDSDTDLAAAAMKVGEELGNVFRAIVKAESPQSPGGVRIAPIETDRLIIEAEEVVAAGAALLDVLKTRRDAE